jgi:hypothetical protein
MRAIQFVSRKLDGPDEPGHDEWGYFTFKKYIPPGVLIGTVTPVGVI